MNISEQELLSMLEKAYKAGYEGYNEQMTAKCYSIVKKCKDEKSVSCGVDCTLGPSGTPLNWSNPYLSCGTDHHIQIRGTTDSTGPNRNGDDYHIQIRGTTDSTGPNRNGDDFSNIEINPIQDNVSMHSVPNILSYTF